MRPEVQYWDSNLYISFLVKQHRRRREIVAQLLRDASGKPQRIRVAASQLVRAELVPHPSNDAAAWETIERFFQASRDVIQFYALTPRIAKLASQLVSSNLGTGLTVPDAIHLATAIEARADVFFTWDGEKDLLRRRSGGLLQFDGKLGNPPAEDICSASRSGTAVLRVTRTNR